MFTPFYNSYYTPYCRPKVFTLGDYALFHKGSVSSMAKELITDINMQMSAAMPVYNHSNSISQISNQIQSQNYNNNLKTTLTDLKSSASKLVSYRADSVFNTDSYASNNNDVVKVNSSSDYSGSSVAIDVQQLAQKQITSTNGLSSSGNTINTTGSLTINRGTESFNINLDLSSCTNDKNSLNKIASKINQANAGVTASVKDTHGISHLEVVSNNTGEDSQFTLSFSDSLAHKITSFNTQESKNAEYKIDGTSYTSNTNDFKICDDKINIKLTGTGTARIQRGYPDEDKILDSVQNFVNKYNTAVNYTSDNSSRSEDARMLNNSLKDINYNSRSLSNIGIDVSYDGTLSVDSDRFKSALRSDPSNVKDIISNTARNTLTKTNSELTALQTRSNYTNNNITNNLNNIYSYNPLNNQISTLSNYFSGSLFNFYI